MYRLNSHIVQATSLGLGGEYLVQDTVMRIQRLKSLVDVSGPIVSSNDSPAPDAKQDSICYRSMFCEENEKLHGCPQQAGPHIWS